MEPNGIPTGVPPSYIPEPLLRAMPVPQIVTAFLLSFNHIPAPGTFGMEKSSVCLPR